MKKRYFLLISTYSDVLLFITKWLMVQVPGFRSFVIETFATNCCLYSVLDRSFDFRDANTVRFLYSCVIHSFSHFSSVIILPSKITM